MSKHRSALLIVMNHELTDEQEESAKSSLGVKCFHSLPEDLRAIWGSISPDLGEINDYLTPVKEWLNKKSQEGDFVLIQGDPGACFIIAKFCMFHGLNPIYSTTKREIEKEILLDGTVKIIRKFRHVRFRPYGS